MNIQSFDTAIDSQNFPDGIVAGTGLTLAFLRSSQDCVKLIGTDGRLKFMNENGLCAMELPDLDEVRGYFWWDLWPAESVDLLKTSVEAAAQGQMVEFKAYCPTGAGTPKHWNVIVAPIVESNGVVSNLLVMSREID